MSSNKTLTMPRIFWPGISTSNIPTTLFISRKSNENEFHKIISVLRAQKGDMLRMFSDQRENFNFIYQIVDISKNEIKIEFQNKEQVNSELEFDLSLFLCAPHQPEILNLTIEKAVELGVSKIYLLQSEFTQIRHNLNQDKIRKIVIEAVRQSERTSIPTVELIKQSDFYNFLFENKEETIIALERSKNSPDLPKTFKLDNKRINLLIGPEGGFSQTEIEFFTKNKFKTISISPSVLRVETAAIAGLGIINYFLS